MCIENILKAYKGKFIWMTFGNTDKYDKLIFIAEKDPDYLSYIVCYLDCYLKFLKKRTARERLGWYEVHSVQEYTKELDRFDLNILVITTSYIANILKKFTDYPFDIKIIKEGSLESLLVFYSLVNVSPKWKIVSTRFPFTIFPERMLGINGIGKREIVCYDLYELDEIPCLNTNNITEISCYIKREND